MRDLQARSYSGDMPYDITGWIETTYMTPDVRAEVFAMGDEDACRWSATVCLDGLGLMGDASSDLLFGLVKQPSGKGLFVDRGLPPDVSLPVLRVYEEDQRQGYDLIGYTYATLAEVQSVRWHEHGVALNESVWWSHIVCLMDDLSEMDMFDAERVRIVVWASW